MCTARIARMSFIWTRQGRVLSVLDIEFFCLSAGCPQLPYGYEESSRI
ncbi:hypothetical protein E3G66_003551 [Mycobacteroides abscessus]|nr:hypothetical protein E3G66_003551 [Mycobacteroides abscessus]SLG56098.1 Uncharacterised protein [Mycobacteroides abscessus subsp. abscessus]